MSHSQQEDHNVPARRERLWTPVFVCILMCTLAAFMVGQGSNAGTTVYLDRVGGTAALAGIGALCFSVAAAAARIASGPVIDTRGRRIIMLAGSVVMLAGTLGPLLANDGAVFMVWRMLQGAGFSAVTTAAATAAADIMPAARLGEGIGYYGLGQAVSMSIGPALAIFLVSTDPPSNLYAGLTVCAALAFGFALACRYEAHPDRLPATSGYRVRWEGDGEPAARPDEGTTEQMAAIDAEDEAGLPWWRRLIHSVFEPKALSGTIPITLMSAMFSFGIFYMGLFGAHLGVASPGLFYTVSAVVMIVIRLTSSRFMDSAPAIRIMGIATVAGIVAFLMALGCEQGIFGEATGVAFVAMGLPYGVGLGLAIPVNQAVAVKMSPSSRWGAANALFMLGVDTGNAVAATAWGFLSETAGFSVCIIGVIACCIASYAAARVCYPPQ